MDVSAHKVNQKFWLCIIIQLKKSLPFHLSHTKPEKVERGARATRLTLTRTGWKWCTPWLLQDDTGAKVPHQGYKPESAAASAAAWGSEEVWSDTIDTLIITCRSFFLGQEIAKCKCNALPFYSPDWAFPKCNCNCSCAGQRVFVVGIAQSSLSVCFRLDVVQMALSRWGFQAPQATCER